MKRIPTFVSDDNGSIIHIIKKTIKNYSSMKAMHLIIAMLVMMSLASCSADGNDPVENSVSNVSPGKKRMEPEALHTRKTILTS